MLWFAILLPMQKNTDTIPHTAVTPLLTAFLEFLQFSEGLSHNTLAAYRRDLQLYQAWLTHIQPPHFSNADDKSSPPIQWVTAQMLEAFMHDVQTNGRSAKSNARLLSTLKRFYQWGSSHQGFLSDPTTLLKSPKLPQTLPTVLSEQHVVALLNAPDVSTPLGLRDRAILELMYATGLRVSETVHLPFEQVNLSAGLVQVTGKGNKERIVPLGEFAIEWIERYVQQARPVLVGERWVNSLFVSRLGRTMTRQTLWHRIHQLAQGAGIEVALSPHTLRHAFATHLINYGADLRTVQLLLGHSDLSSTQIYTHVAKARLHELHQKHHPRG